VKSRSTLTAESKVLTVIDRRRGEVARSRYVGATLKEALDQGDD